MLHRNRSTSLREMEDKILDRVDLIFGIILTAFRGNTSDGTKSVIVGIVKHISFLKKSSCVECIVICMTPPDSVFIALIVPIGSECLTTCISRRVIMVLEIKFAVAPMSNRTRHLIQLRLRSQIYTKALVNNCGAYAILSRGLSFSHRSCQSVILFVQL